MEQLSRLQARIGNLGDLLDTIGAMRAVAGARLQQAQLATKSVRRYTQMIDEALAAAVDLAAGTGENRAAVTSAGSGAVLAFGTEHGLVGAFNEHVLDKAAALLTAAEDRLLVVGTRAAALAEERRLPVAWQHAMATRADGVAEVARAAADALERLSADSDTARFCLVHARRADGTGWTLVERALLPFDPRPYLAARRTPPLHQLPAPLLLAGLIEEFVFGEIMQAALDSFAAENAARLARTEAARSAIQDRLDALRREERQRRQEEITTELLDVITGVSAQESDASR